MRHWSVLLIATIACGSQGTNLRDMNASADGGDAAQTNAHTMFVDPFAGAPPYAKPGKKDTSHNAGRSCSGKSCHGSEGPSFLIGGTVYQDYAATTPAVGVEVRVVDKNGNAASTYSDSVGNFYIRSGTTNVAFPAHVGVRDATTSRPMIAELSGAMGSCGQASCHEQPVNPNAYDPIHIP